ncbi:hypothetical protein LPW11_20295 [Geomonas sp. RF6]|uniref:hypothetical protein n=1 Tax=Geomonas sp. RF6 TaxID=2897342 RepID=UPI001E34EDED|nr:hypothetical protein [Geomonas sp. RF6]UFS70202.1 hypothetical protein LPW11_20295 [Geomonas sp. RF6]
MSNKTIDGRDLKFASSQGIRTVLYTVPQYHERIRYLSNHSGFLQAVAIVSGVWNIGYVNYGGDDLCRDCTLFYDATDLNRKGARLFSEKLARVVAGEFAGHDFAGGVADPR